MLQCQKSQYLNYWLHTLYQVVAQELCKCARTHLNNSLSTAVARGLPLPPRVQKRPQMTVRNK